MEFACNSDQLNNGCRKDVELSPQMLPQFAKLLHFLSLNVIIQLFRALFCFYLMHYCWILCLNGLTGFLLAAILWDSELKCGINLIWAKTLEICLQCERFIIWCFTVRYLLKNYKSFAHVPRCASLGQILAGLFLWHFIFACLRHTFFSSV